MGHRNARLTVHGRRLLVERVRSGSPVSHVAKAMGVSRQCAHRWVNRYAEAGEAGLLDRSSRPHSSPTRTPAEVEHKILEVRVDQRRGQDWIGPELGVAPRTVSRVLRRHGVSYLRDLDPLTGQIIRASKATALHYERDTPGELVHMDVKKLGRIPDGGGWKAHGRQMGSTAAKKRAKIGFDYVHSVVDDHTRLAYSEIHDDEQGATVTGFFERALAWFAELGVTVREVMTDNHWSYTRTASFTALLADNNIKHRRIRPHCPWQNGKVERFNRTLQTEWAYRHVFDSNQARNDALAPWLHSYNTSRRHSALAGQPPTSRLSPT